MTKILKDGQFAESDFRIVDGDADLSSGHIVVPMQTYLANQESLAGRNDVGVWLAANEQVEDIEQCVHDIAVIALDFPAFADGRSFSNAVMLRKHYGFEGEIRAFGDVRSDQLEQLSRCGFDAFELAQGQDETHAAARVSVFKKSYQTTLREPGIIDQRASGSLN